MGSEADLERFDRGQKQGCSGWGQHLGEGQRGEGGRYGRCQSGDLVTQSEDLNWVQPPAITWAGGGFSPGWAQTRQCFQFLGASMVQ